jgi:transcriptional regulator with XRE-family HTH domain
LERLIDRCRMARSGFGKRFPARDSAVTKALAVNVKRLRAERGLTQDGLAVAVELEQAAISMIENGRANPTLLNLESIAVALGVDFRDLFDPAPKPKRLKDK